MEQQIFSLRSVSISALLHALLLFLLLCLVQSDPFKLTPEERQEEAAVMLMPTQPPALQATQVSTASSFDSAQDERSGVYPEPSRREGQAQEKAEQSHQEQEFVPTPQAPRTQSTSPMHQRMQRTWSPDHAKQAWRKKQAPAQQTPSPEHNPQQTYQDGLMHTIIEGIPIEADGVPLTKRVKAQWAKEGQDHFQHSVIKTICYELNKQKIMEASSNLPHKIVLKVVLERSGNLISAELIEKSYSPRFDEACIRAIYAAAPYRRAPASCEGDPVTLLFTLYHERSQAGAMSNVPTPITFYIN